MIEVFYFFYFQSIAIYMAYLPAYLRALGLSGRELSTVFAVPPLLALGIPLVWAWVADRTRRHARILRIVICGAWLGFTPILFAEKMGADRFPVIFAGWTGYALFSVAVGGLADAMAVARVREGAVYGRLRFWGSAGFVVAAVALGAILTARSTGPAQIGPDRLVPLAMWIALGCAFGAALRLRGTGAESARPQLRDAVGLLGDRRFRTLLLAAGLHWICLVPYNVYFGVFLRDLHLSPFSWGLGYSVGVVTEMAVFLVFARLEARFRLEHLLAVAFAVSALRWLGVATIESAAVLIALQLLHGITFGLFWSAAMAAITAVVPAPVRATGQAMLVMSINLGSALGNTVTGRLYDASGPRILFLLAAAGELLPLIVILRSRRSTT